MKPTKNKGLVSKLLIGIASTTISLSSGSCGNVYDRGASSYDPCLIKNPATGLLETVYYQGVCDEFKG